jgi:phage/plasmid-associated DNA primase
MNSDEINYLVKTQVDPDLRILNSFLSNKFFATSRGSEYTNIFNQRTGGMYCLPFYDRKVPNDGSVIWALPNSDRPQTDNDAPNIGVEEEPTMLEKYLMAANRPDDSSFMSPLDEFFCYYEQCRLRGMVMGFAEKQYFQMPLRRREAAADETSDSTAVPKVALSNGSVSMFASLLEAEPEAKTATESKTPAPDSGGESRFAPMSNEKSCIELDFDIYQRDPQRVVDDSKYEGLIQNILRHMLKHLDFENMEDLGGMIRRGPSGNTAVKVYAAVLRKPKVVETNHHVYGKCWKDSFHIRIYLKVSKEYKRFLIGSIIRDGVLSFQFEDIPMLNPPNDALDKAYRSSPAMLLGSCKNSGTVAHEFYMLLAVTFYTRADGLVNVSRVPDLNPLPEIAPEVVAKPGRPKLVKPAPKKYKHNLSHELSLNFEVANGVIKKPEVDPLPALLSSIQSFSERTTDGLISQTELDEIENHVTDLAARDYEVKFHKEILNILSPERVARYESWRDIIMILAQHNPDYKPLAIWFSQRCPRAWVNNGSASLESIWECAVNKPRAKKRFVAYDDEDDNDDGSRSNGRERTIKTLYAWAKEDNPVRYIQARELCAFHKLMPKILESGGKLNDNQIAEVLKLMYGDCFITDFDQHTNARGNTGKKWYEFVFPENNGQFDSGELYKWRYEPYPDNLHKYIAKKFTMHLREIADYTATRCNDEAEDERVQKFYSSLKSNIGKLIHGLGSHTRIETIIKECAIEFRERGFIQNLDTYPDYIGVNNGVLRLDRTEFIDRYHQIPISRTTRTQYNVEKIDPATVHEHPNPRIRYLWTELRRIFYHDEDAFHFTMTYLASSLDGRVKNPFFFIWLGEGSNGKSAILELHMNTLGLVTTGGYATKINSSFFTCKKRNEGGPDSEKMTLKSARFTCCSESEAGDALRMAKIKEFTSDTLSGNEKHKTQEIFKSNCHFVFASNNDPRVSGRDYGTWRRILVYRFKMQFKHKPDPSNPQEYKSNEKFIKIFTTHPEYRSAYFSILMHFYELYRDRYNYNLDNVPRPTIDAETQAFQNEQDLLSRFISQRLIEVGESAPHISISTLVERYNEWLHVVDGSSANAKETAREFSKTAIKGHIFRKENGENYLKNYRVLKMDEDPDRVKKDIKPAAPFAELTKEIKSAAPATPESEGSVEFIGPARSAESEEVDLGKSEVGEINDFAESVEPPGSATEEVDRSDEIYGELEDFPIDE